MNYKKIKFISLSFIVLITVATNAQKLEKLRTDFTKLKFGMFIHFNMGTFHEKEWVDPGQDPMSFNPTKLDCRQWAKAAKKCRNEIRSINDETSRWILFVG
jgi:alpha-L-fucosidase